MILHFGELPEWNGEVPVDCLPRSPIQRAIGYNPMTMIAAFDCGDFLLLSADTQLTDGDGYTLEIDKLGHIDGQPLAWGFSGDYALAQDWADWFKAQPQPWPSWQALKSASTDELSRLNGKRREIMKLAGVEANANDLTDILIAGYVDGSPEILEIDNRGVATFVLGLQHLGVIGSGKVVFVASIMTARTLLKKDALSDQTALGVFELSVRLATGCSLPLKIFRIKPTGITEMRKSDVQLSKPTISSTDQT